MRVFEIATMSCKWNEADTKSQTKIVSILLFIPIDNNQKKNTFLIQAKFEIVLHINAHRMFMYKFRLRAFWVDACCAFVLLSVDVGFVAHLADTIATSSRRIRKNILKLSESHYNINLALEFNWLVFLKMEGQWKCINHTWQIAVNIIKVTIFHGLARKIKKKNEAVWCKEWIWKMKRKQARFVLILNEAKNAAANISDSLDNNRLGKHTSNWSRFRTKCLASCNSSV